MSFNEMNDRLKGAESRETRVRLLAENLFRRGLVMTMASARQMAESMVDTERKVQQRFEEQRGGATHYPPSGVSGQREIPLASKGFLHQVEGQPRSEYADLSALKENAQRLRERAANPRPVEIQTHYETPRNGGNAKAVAPRGEELSAADFVDLKPDMLVSEAAEESPVAPHAAVPTPSPSPVSSASADEEPAEDDDFIELTPAPESEASAAENADEPLLELEEDAPGAPGQEAEEEFVAAADESVPSPEDGSEYVTLGEEAEHEAEPGDEELGGGNDEESTEPPKADPSAAAPAKRPDAEPAAHERAEEPAPEKPRENLAKKFGVDLGSIFNVNK